MADKELKDLEFKELVDEATRQVHDGLLTKGSAGMRSAIWSWLSTAIQWSDERKKREDEK